MWVYTQTNILKYWLIKVTNSSRAPDEFLYSIELGYGRNFSAFRGVSSLGVLFKSLTKVIHANLPHVFFTLYVFWL
jgi:hypothetical protein